MAQTRFFHVDFAIIAKFLACRLNYFIGSGISIFVTTKLLTITTILWFVFICIDRPYIYDYKFWNKKTPSIQWMSSNIWNVYVIRLLLGISGGVSFLTYLPTTPSFMVLSLLFRDNISVWLCYSKCINFNLMNFTCVQNSIISSFIFKLILIIFNNFAFFVLCCSYFVYYNLL